jgi:uncharacterized membrane protein YedE/YeeE
VQKRSSPWFAAEFSLPTNRAIEWRVMSGSVLFGIGWGLYGYCPGPAIASLSTFNWQPGLFVLAMIVGMLAENGLRKE